jgi:DNA helicase-2/ATP-dependent DNA helicase PcrA
MPRKYDVSMEQLSLYAIGYQELSGEKADFLQVYNMDKNYPDTKEIQIHRFRCNESQNSISGGCNHGKMIYLKPIKQKNCKECRLVKVCSGAANL